MKRSEYILAQKTLAAREVRTQSQTIKGELEKIKATAMLQGSNHKKETRNADSNKNLSSLQSSFSLTELNLTPPKPSTEFILNSPTLRKSQTLPSLPANTNSSAAKSREESNSSSQKQRSATVLDSSAMNLVEELSQRTVTDKTNLRKLQHQVYMSLKESGQFNSSNGLNRSASRSSDRIHSNNNNNNNNNINNNGVDGIVRAQSVNSRRPATTSSYENLFSNNNPTTTSAGSANSAKITPRQSTTALSTTNNTNQSQPRQSALSSISETNNATNDTTGSGTVQNNRGLAKDDNYFMPKKKILRQDGATLFDVYESKRQDMWGLILKAQIKEDEVTKLKERKLKEERNQEYGRLIKEQVEGNNMRKAENHKEHEIFAILEQQTAKKYDDLQKKRTDEAIARHKQFISNALEDMHTKFHQRQRELREELTASAIMINHDKELLAQAEEKKLQEKEYHKRYQEQIFHENLENIRRKEELKLRSFSEDKRIFEENELQFRREQERREFELSQKLSRTSEGPAHHIVDAIVKTKKQKDDHFFHTIQTSENNLNKQLKASEDAARLRATQNGESLTEEWIRNAEIKAKLRKEEEDRNNKILSMMREMLAREEKEDREKREKKVQAAARYQQELDAQVTALRQRSIESLKKTMSEQETKYNSDLIEKTAVYL